MYTTIIRYAQSQTIGKPYIKQCWGANKPKG